MTDKRIAYFDPEFANYEFDSSKYVIRDSKVYRDFQTGSLRIKKTTEEDMIKPYKQKITHIYKPAYKTNVQHFAAFVTEGDCWEYIIDSNRYGLDREYTPTKKEVKAEGWRVVKYKLVEE